MTTWELLRFVQLGNRLGRSLRIMRANFQYDIRKCVMPTAPPTPSFVCTHHALVPAYSALVNREIRRFANADLSVVLSTGWHRSGMTLLPTSNNLISNW